MEVLNLYDELKVLSQDDVRKKFINLCDKGDFDAVRYILTNEDLKKHINEEVINTGYVWACSNEHIDVVNYLLTSPDLITHADIHAGSDNGFILAAQDEKLDIIKFLIFDMNIKKTKAIEDYLAWESYEEIENWFKTRELKINLDLELDNNKVNNKKNKV